LGCNKAAHLKKSAEVGCPLTGLPLLHWVVVLEILVYFLTAEGDFVGEHTVF